MKIFHGNKIKKPYLILFIITILISLSLFRYKGTKSVNAQGINGSVDLTWEKKEVEEREISVFTQVYDMILSRRLTPLYDTSLKFQFRSETTEGKDENRTQFLPIVNVNLGTRMIDFTSGWSKDNIEDDAGTYSNERFFTTFKLNPKKLPNILFQYWTEDRDRIVDIAGDEREYNLTFMEDYDFQIGLLKINHNYRTNRKDNRKDIETTYELSNKARIAHKFSLFDDILDIGGKYEFNYGKDKDGDEKKNTTSGHNGNIDLDIKHNPRMNTNYKFLLGIVEDKTPDNRETSLGHDLSFLYLPNNFISAKIGGSYNRYTRTIDDSARDRTNYSFKLTPDIIGLFFDSNDYYIYPIKSYILINRSSEESDGDRKERNLSFLLNGSTTLYKGVNINIELGSSRKKNNYITGSTETDPVTGQLIIRNIRSSKEYETWLDVFLNLRIKPALRGSIKHRNQWNRYIGGLNEGREFDGEIETKLTYNPVETFIVGFGLTIEYGNEESSYEYDIGWRPKNKKTEINVQYESGDDEEDEYFFGQLNYNLSKTIQFRFQYRYPSETQRQIVQFTLNF